VREFRAGVVQPSLPLFGLRGAWHLSSLRVRLRPRGAHSAGQPERSEKLRYTVLSWGMVVVRVCRADLALAKAACHGARYVDDRRWLLADVLPHWDELMLRSFAHIQGKRHLYQESPLSALRRPEELVTYCFGTTSGLPEGTIMFCGTVPANGGIQAAIPHRSDFKTNHQAQL